MLHAVAVDGGVKISAWMAPGATMINYRFGWTDPDSGELVWCDVESWRAYRGVGVAEHLRRDWLAGESGVITVFS